MNADQVRDLTVYWGDPGPAPAPTWRCCAWCGNWYGPEILYWRNSHKRICRACNHDACIAGIYPRPWFWLAKHRWSVDGVLERYCPRCPRRRRWHQLSAFYYCNHYGHDTKRRVRTCYPSAYCAGCMRRRRRRPTTENDPHG